MLDSRAAPDAGHRLRRTVSRFLLCWRRLRRGLPPARVRSVMNLESVTGLVISVLLLAYLVYAMLRPEKF